MASNASPELLWQIVKNSSSFLVKKNGNSSCSVQFSSEPNNLYNLNTFKYSGLANKKTVSIVPAGDDAHVVLTTTKTRKGSKPSQAYHRTLIKGDFRKKANVVVDQVAKNKYRPDLKRAALAKLSAVYRSLCVSKTPKLKGRKGRKRTSA